MNRAYSMAFGEQQSHQNKQQRWSKERKNVQLLNRAFVSLVYLQRISFLSFVVVVLFFVEADNMHDVSIYFALVYWRREQVMVVKRVKSCFLGGLSFRGLRF